MERLDKILSNMGFGTRKEVKKIVKNGFVDVDGVMAGDSGMLVDPDKSVICVDGEPIVYKKFIYLMLNKPAGYVSATEDNRHATVADLVPDEFVHFEPFPVGRLDIDTEGLLVMTNDGALAHRLLSPKKHVPKTYFAQINKPVDQSDIDAFNKGVRLDDGYLTMPAKLGAGQAGEAYVTICEGKFHQVKRMFETVDKQVIYLKRLQMGGLKLDGSLELGQCRELTQEELRTLEEQK